MGQLGVSVDLAVVNAVSQLRDADPTMRNVIDRVGPFTLLPQRCRFRMLVHAILGQQISVKAATTLAGRIADRYGERLKPASDQNVHGLTRLFPTAERLMKRTTILPPPDRAVPF